MYFLGVVLFSLESCPIYMLSYFFLMKYSRIYIDLLHFLKDTVSNINRVFHNFRTQNLRERKYLIDHQRELGEQDIARILIFFNFSRISYELTSIKQTTLSRDQQIKIHDSAHFCNSWIYLFQFYIFSASFIFTSEQI